jgi:hypothetical protein
VVRKCRCVPWQRCIKKHLLTLTGKPVYNKWHESELERWLSDHNIPHPKAAERKDLETIVKDNWNDKVVQPYNSWDAKTLQHYLTLKGYQAKEGAETDTKSLIQQVKGYWTETEDSANQAYSNVRDWIFDTYVSSAAFVLPTCANIP